jgi:hypothetical protein
MRIPSTFQLGGIVWKVVYVDILPGLMGQCDMQKAEIHILKSLPKQIKEQTFCHEFFHALLFAMGKMEHDEVFVDSAGVFLHQYLNSAK